jgi:TatD DNase family protein
VTPLIDSHVNLHAAAFEADRADVIARARAAGVGLMVTICDRFENAEAVAEIADAHPDIFMSVGAHPHHAKDHQTLTAEALVAFAQSHPKVAAIGETGLDLHYGYSPLSDQERVLAVHAEAARALDLPLIIHTREADAQMMRALERQCAQGPLRLLLHCYTSGLDLARFGLDLGATISLSGIVTFKSANAVRAVGEAIPLDRLILETDCPYLAPIPHRGRRNEPAFLADVHRFVCGWRGLDPEAAAIQFADNFFRLFHTVPRPPAFSP